MLLFISEIIIIKKKSQNVCNVHILEKFFRFVSKAEYKTFIKAHSLLWLYVEPHIYMRIQLEFIGPDYDSILGLNIIANLNLA